MENMAGLLGGVGLAGILAAALMAFVTMLILPLWAVFECAVSRRSGGAKAVVLVLLVLTWGLGSIVYGLFITTSRLLRIVTVLAVFGIAAIFVPSVVSVLAGAGIHGNHRAEAIRREMREIVDRFHPAAIPARDVAPFHALHITYGDFGPATAAVARFTAAGPDRDSARDTDRRVRQVAFDGASGRYWALTTHDFGAIEPSSGRFTPIAVDPALGDFSWPTGVAFDAKDRAVYVTTSHVYTQFYRFDPGTRRWRRLPSEIRDLPLVALTHSTSDGCLYALEYRSGDRALRRLHRFNKAGASLGSIDLHPAVPVSDDAEGRFQLHASGNRLVLILPPLTVGSPRDGSADGASRTSRTFVLDPASGKVFHPETASIAAGVDQDAGRATAIGSAP